MGNPTSEGPSCGRGPFNFCVTRIFWHSLGWDFDEQKSTSSGDILGKLEVFQSLQTGILHVVFFHTQTLPTYTKVCMMTPAFKKVFCDFLKMILNEQIV